VVPGVLVCALAIFFFFFFLSGQSAFILCYEVKGQQTD